MAETAWWTPGSGPVAAARRNGTEGHCIDHVGIAGVQVVAPASDRTRALPRGAESVGVLRLALTSRAPHARRIGA
ncbi:hypothetical protein [uncultured Xanthomonas sp.]|uniref:hypothetical protein n=1 Tax=uncultured Xanthomonas sp. TaxID=152831 RepID=UPI0025E2B8C8|nr:hypothetical protein [uncultured Xanthomonas sp.]